MTENPKVDFDASPEGQYFVNDKTAKNAWLGYHTYLDECLTSDPEDYALTFYQKLSRADALLVFDIKMETVVDMLSEMDFGKNSVTAIVTRDGREVAVIQNPDGEQELVQDETYFVGQSFLEESRESEELTNLTVKVKGKSYVYIAMPVKKTGIMLCALIPRSNLTEQARSIGVITVIMVILATAAALLCGGKISMGISKTVKEVTGGLSKVAEGDLTSHFATKRKDEFGLLTASLNSMLESIRALMNDMKSFGTKVSQMATDVSAQAGGISRSIDSTSQTMEDLGRKQVARRVRLCDPGRGHRRVLGDQCASEWRLRDPRRHLQGRDAFGTFRERAGAVRQSGTGPVPAPDQDHRCQGGSEHPGTPGRRLCGSA